jgi:phage nucleotide-binding protein
MTIDVNDLTESVDDDTKAKDKFDDKELATPVEDAGTDHAETDEILAGLLGRIGDVSQVTKYTKVLIFGQPGAGKTVFSASTPKTLIVDIERGALSINNHPSLKGNAEFMEFRSTFQLEKLIEYLKADHEAFTKYETIVIDSFTALQARDLDDVVKAEAAKDASRNPFLPTGPDYNVNTRHMQKIAADLRDVNKNIIVICHVKEVKDDTTGAVLKRADVTPKLASSLNGIFDVVGYLSADDVRRTLQCHPTREIAAKTRLGGLPPVIENPSFQTILDAKKETLDN